MKRILVSFAAMTAAALPATFIACSSSNSNGPSDAGTGSETSTGNDGSMPGTDGGNPSTDGGNGLPDGATPPQGTQVVQTGDTVVIGGVTSDGYIIYSDTTNDTMDAVSVSGGAPMNIGALTTAPDIVTSGPVALVWQGAQGTTITGSLSIWTKAGGMLKQISTASIDPIAAQVNPIAVVDVSSDGSKVLFWDNAKFGTGSATADLTVVGADGSGKTVLSAGVHFDDPSCAPSARFVGSDVVAVLCTGGADAGAPDGGEEPIGSLQFFAGATGTGANITTGGVWQEWATDGKSQVLYFNATGAYLWKAGMVGAGTSVTGPDHTTGAAFSADGSSLIYLTGAGAFQSVAVASPSGATTLASGFAGLSALSPDTNWALLNKMSNSTNGTSDLYLASTKTAGTPATLDSMADAVLFNGVDLFTADSSHAIWFQNVDSMAGTGDLYVAATSGGTPTKVASGVWADLSGAGSKVIYNNNCTGCSGMSNTGGYADLVVQDVSSSGAAPTIISSLADETFFTSPDHTKVVYTWSYQMGPKTGIWVYPIP